MARLLLVGIPLLVTISACVSRGPSYAEIEERIPKLAPGFGRMFFFRGDDSRGGPDLEINVNGVIVGQLDGLGDSASASSRNFFFVDRPAGTFEIRARSARALAFSWKQPLIVDLGSGDTLFVEPFFRRKGLGFGGYDVKNVLVDPSAGRSRLSSGYYVGPEGALEKQ